MTSSLQRALVTFAALLAALTCAISPAFADEAEQPTLADIAYVYIDETVVSVDEEQYIVVALADDQAVFTSATLVITSPETGAALSADAETMVDNTVLFAFSFGDGDATNYALSTLTYTLEGSETVYELELEVDDSCDYAFDVVSASTAEVLASTATDSEDITVITITDDGALAATETLEDALDASGVATTLLALSLDTTSDTHLVIALDPGHGGVDGGASANGLVESELNWKIANYCKTELETYAGVEVYLTRDEDETVSSLETRVLRAVGYGADVIISIHCNSGGASGCEIYVPNEASYNYALHTEGTELAEDILAQLTALGLKDRGVKTRDATEYTYDDEAADYYGIIRYARQNGIVGIIIEHAFLDNSTDAAFLSVESNLEALGVADATGIAEYFGLVKESESTDEENIDVVYRVHMQTYGWQALKYDGDTAGSTTLSKRLEAIEISIEDTELSGSITYRVYAQTDGWLDWVCDGETAGTTGESKHLEAIEIELTDELAEAFDVYYRVYVEDYGWLDWACNGQTAGTSGLSLRIEAIEIMLVEKDGEAPGDTTQPYIEYVYSISYVVHCQTYGWMTALYDGETAGTTGLSKRLEAIQITLNSSTLSSLGSISYRVHCQTYGWLDWVTDGETAGTTGLSKRLEAIEIVLTGELAELYDVYYRVHVQTYGWLDWACNGETAGTTGLSKRLEAIEIVLVEKGSDPPGDTTTTCIIG